MNILLKMVEISRLLLKVKVDLERQKQQIALEAFGNAKTSRNCNFNRFGKLIDVYYNPEGTISVSGACIKIFLLEKSQVSQISPGERPFHIFYQMCAGLHLLLRID
ncbi:hypothetical protein L1887_15204 [Cichorium endivia]|nr:hypothetical protein L1887_15204 [Cichorium endivia]